MAGAMAGRRLRPPGARSAPCPRRQAGTWCRALAAKTCRCNGARTAGLSGLNVSGRRPPRLPSTTATMRRYQ